MPIIATALTFAITVVASVVVIVICKFGAGCAAAFKWVVMANERFIIVQLVIVVWIVNLPSRRTVPLGCARVPISIVIVGMRPTLGGVVPRERKTGDKGSSVSFFIAIISERHGTGRPGTRGRNTIIIIGTTTSLEQERFGGAGGFRGRDEEREDPQRATRGHNHRGQTQQAEEHTTTGLRRRPRWRMTTTRRLPPHARGEDALLVVVRGTVVLDIDTHVSYYYYEFGHAEGGRYDRLGC